MDGVAWIRRDDEADIGKSELVQVVEWFMRSEAAIASLCVTYLGLSLPGLTDFPRVIADESWNAAQGYSFAQEGRLRNPVIQGRWGMDRAFVQPRVTQSIVLAGFYRVFGFSLWSGRAASAAVGLLAVLGVYFLMRAWLPVSGSLVIAALVVVDPWFLIVSRMVRDEVYLTCTSVWMLALLAHGLVQARPHGSATGRVMPRRLLVAAAGATGGLACYTHPNTVMVVILTALLVVYQVGARKALIQVLPVFGVGAIASQIPFIAYVIGAQIHHQVSFFEQLGAFYTRPAFLPITEALQREWSRWTYFLAPAYRWPWLVVLAGGVVAALRRRHPLQVWALVMIIGHGMLMALLIRSSSSKYLVVLTPWLAALVVMACHQLMGLDDAPESESSGTEATSRAARPKRRLVAYAGLGTTLAVMLSSDAYLAYSYRNADYDAVCRRIANGIPADSRVYGNLVFWTGLHQYPFLSNTNEVAVSLEEAERNLRARLAAFDPEYVIREADLCWSLGGTGPRKADFHHRSEGRGASGEIAAQFVARQDTVVDELIRTRGVLVDAFTTFDYGAIEVYQIR